MIINPEQKIEELSEQGCDICEHFSLMLKYGKQCEYITEMGVRGVVSTWGWVASNPKKLVCYDINPCPVENVVDTCANLGIDFSFYVADTRELEIEETDLLFIDTEHTYDQMQKELELHGNKARKFLIFHDTAWAHDMNRAIAEFMETNPHWIECETVENNNGFRIIKRT